MKSCTICKTMKVLTDFYKHPKMPDGHLNQCKECKKAAQAKTRSDNLEYYQEYDRNRPNKKERAEAVVEYRKTDKGQEVAKLCYANYKANHPIKIKATNAVNNAVRDGRLVKPTSCSACQVDCNPHGHHCDYGKPLDVIWLCEPCHVQWHLHNKPIVPQE